ncbi:MAG TPA: protein kinase [Myxococcales bacterium]
MEDAATALGQNAVVQALEASVRAQDWGLAARHAVTLGRHLDAAKYFLVARQPYEAAVCFQKAGAQNECLSALMQVPPSSPRYRPACVHAVRVAASLGTPLTSLSDLVARFIGTMPTSRAEAAACCQLAASIAQTNPHLARSIYGLVFLAFPDDAVAKDGLDSLRPPPGAVPPPAAAAPAAPPPMSRAATSPPMAAAGLASRPPLAGQATPMPFTPPAAGAAGRSPLAGQATPLPFTPPAAGVAGRSPLAGQATPIPFTPPAAGVASRSPLVGQATPRPFTPPAAGAASRPPLAGQATPMPFTTPAAGVAGRPPPAGQVTPLPFSPRAVSLNPATDSPAGRGQHKQGLREILASRGSIPAEKLERLIKEQPEATASDTKLADAIVAAGLLTDIEVVRALSEHTGIAHLSEEQVLASAVPESAVALTLKQAERWTVCPISLLERRLWVAMRDPRDIALIDQLRFASGVNHVTGVFATQMGILRGIRKLYRGEEPEQQSAEDWKGKVWDSDAEPPTPFSDRYTGTREHQFDTQDLTNRLLAEAAADGETAAPAPAPEPARAKAGATLAMQLRPAGPSVGTTIANRYRLEALLGEGGTATVYKATDLELGESVAIKLFRPATTDEAETLVTRFKQELSLSRILNHPNIVRLYDLGSHEGWRYLSMELLVGNDMAQLLAGNKTFPLVQGLRYLEQVCAGLQVAHDHGVIHRDVKPQNLFVTGDGVVKVMDFGIAKKLLSTGVTVTGTVCGTPDFISPEQIRDFSNVTPLADLYALGGTAFMMFTGTPPFTHPDLMGQIMAHSTEAPPSPRLKNPQIPVELEAVILRLLEKDPARRFPSARELGQELVKIRRILEAHEQAVGANP